MGTRPVCQRCQHFYLTYEPTMPYGCRAMQFKSAQSPALVVFSSSGMDCQLFLNRKTEQETKETSGVKKRTA